MKDAILGLLELPRRIARSGVAIETCPHGGNFVPGERRCQLCHNRMECEWLYHTDEFSALKERPAEYLVDALRFAAAYVDAHVTATGHRRQRCGCDVCSWLRDANGLLAEQPGPELPPEA